MNRLLLAVFVLLLMTRSLPAQDGPRPEADLRIEQLVGSISVDRLRQLLTTLTSFGTRSSSGTIWIVP